MNFINTTDLMPPEWRFIANEYADPAAQWQVHSGRPRNVLERLIQRPHIGRYRAAITAARAARNCENAILVSHLPRMAAATNTTRKVFCPQVPMIAFAFNFTDLPQGVMQRSHIAAFKGIEEFIVFSNYEKALYARHLDIPEDRIRFLPWAMDLPKVGEVSPVSDRRPYLCSIGGEGRDYATLIEAMKQHRQVRLVIVARPHSLKGIELPENVQAFTNLPVPQTWRIARDSIGMVLPLLSEKTPCGHITIVGAQQLGIPLVATRSLGTDDYLSDGETARLVPQANSQALAEAIAALLDDRPAADSMAQRAQQQACRDNALSKWTAYFREASARLAKTVGNRKQLEKQLDTHLSPELLEAVNQDTPA